MTITEDRPRITRPGDSVAVEPRNVMALRKLRRLTRKQMSDAIAALALVNDNGRPVSLLKDAIGKIETGQRNPSVAAFAAICAVLGCEPEALAPGAPVIPLSPGDAEAEDRLEYQRELRDFALARGLRYKNTRNGRVYYGLRLREAYERYLDLAAAEGSGDPEAEAAARAAYRRALARVPRTAGSGPEQQAS